jgi:NTP pyrophosphatase (non-canonical NTP hydrolase)
MAGTLRPDPIEATCPRVVLSGSYRRDPPGLRIAYQQLVAEGCEVMSPLSVEFVDEVDGFVMSAMELSEPPAAIEARHIAALRQADFVWLHVPDGYVGPSAALEIGVAHALGVPVYSASPPSDGNLAAFIKPVSSPNAAVTLARAAGPRVPAAALPDLQRYYAGIVAERGFDKETPQDAVLLLIEEVGELARAIRNSVGLARADAGDSEIADELADVQLYLVHLANLVGLQLAPAVIAKERRNRQRYGRVPA